MKKNKDNPEQFQVVTKNLADQFHHDCKALELWKRTIVNETPWVGDGMGDELDPGDMDCFFCGNYYPNHADYCIWIEAKKLVEESKE